MTEIPESGPGENLRRLLSLAIHAAVYLAVAAWFPPKGDYFYAAALGVCCIWISQVDFERREIPDIAVVLLIVIGALRLVDASPIRQMDALQGAVIWSLLFLGVALGFRQLRGRDGLGFGDVKLIAALGLWLGFQLSVWAVLAAALGGVAVLAMLGTRRDRVQFSEAAIAFGPFLCLAAWAFWLVGGSL